MCSLQEEDRAYREDPQRLLDLEDAAHVERIEKKWLKHKTIKEELEYTNIDRKWE